MDRSNASLLYNPKNNRIDIDLLNIKNILMSYHWYNPKDGVFDFFFADETATNTNYPLYFNLVRYTPTDKYQAFNLSIAGMLTNDGKIVYGGGKSGRLSADNKSILWDDNTTWKAVIAPVAHGNLLNLDSVLDQSTVDSNVIGNILQNIYNY